MVFSKVRGTHTQTLEDLRGDDLSQELGRGGLDDGRAADGLGDVVIPRGEPKEARLVGQVSRPA